MKQNETGFTLLELIVVVFIVSVLAAVVFPSISRTGSSDMESEARKIATLLRYLNDNAVASKATYPLKFEIREQKLSWTGPDGERSEKVKTLKAVYLQSRGEVRDSELIVFFGPLGLQENLEVRLGDNEKDIRVVMNAVSGRAKILTGDEK